ncbi:DUF6274 family protein [Streptomyces sp. M10(2022)]
MSASTARHETRALLRAHLAAASGYRHLTRHCPVCHRLLKLAMETMEAVAAPRPPYAARRPGNVPDAPNARRAPARRPGASPARRPRTPDRWRRASASARTKGPPRHDHQRARPLPGSGRLVAGKPQPV